MGDPLEKISDSVDFEIFRPILNKVFHSKPSALGGRPAWDCVLMFKILLLQQWYSIADDKTEYLINDRLSFQRFLGLSLGDKVPDAKTIWLFRENLKKSGAYLDLFDLFARRMEAQGVITRTGSIVDASFVDVPKQRNSRDDGDNINEGSGNDLCTESVHKCRQKDKDARWVKKNDGIRYGYKNHVKVDRDSKMIVNYSITDASVHDSQEILGLIDDKDKALYADSAYVGKVLHESLLWKNPNLCLQISEKGYRNKPLTDEQKSSNREKSKVRSRVEHVFGHMTTSFGEIFVRSVGIVRARCQIGLKNLAYNLHRYEFLMRYKTVSLLNQV